MNDRSDGRATQLIVAEQIISKEVDRAVDGLEKINSAADKPPITLNKHCAIFQFRARCITGSLG